MMSRFLSWNPRVPGDDSSFVNRLQIALALALLVALLSGIAYARAVVQEPTRTHGNPTATSISEVIATLTPQSPSAESGVIQLSWQDYFWTELYDELAASVGELPGMSVDRSAVIGALSGMHTPNGYSRAADYPVAIAGGSASASVTLAIFPSKDDADSAMETTTAELERSGWESRKVEGLDHNHTCLVARHVESSEALCYMTRDDALIVSYSSIWHPIPDAALQNAVDLANAMDNAYDAVDRPDESRSKSV